MSSRATSTASGGGQLFGKASQNTLQSNDPPITGAEVACHFDSYNRLLNFPLASKGPQIDSRPLVVTRSLQPPHCPQSHNDMPQHATVNSSVLQQGGMRPVEEVAATARLTNSLQDHHYRTCSLSISRAKSLWGGPTGRIRRGPPEASGSLNGTQALVRRTSFPG